MNMRTIEVHTPLTSETLKNLEAGDQVFLSGTIFTARDAAHKRLVSLLDNNDKIPIDLTNQIIYYTGPTPPQPGHIFGSAGPTTSSRMDSYAPRLIAQSGLMGMIGKGNRSQKVIDTMVQYGCVYFAAIGGAGALIAKSIKKADIVCYEELGPEAIYRLEIENMQLIVAIDTFGNNLFVTEQQKYKRNL